LEPGSTPIDGAEASRVGGIAWCSLLNGLTPYSVGLAGPFLDPIRLHLEVNTQGSAKGPEDAQVGDWERTLPVRFRLGF
jgi:hypothetical protein